MGGAGRFRWLAVRGGRRLVPFAVAPVVVAWVAAAALAGCTSQPGRPVSASVNKPNASSRAVAPDLMISGQRSYSESGSVTSAYDANYAYARVASCRSSRPVLLRVAARWRYKGQTVYLTAMQVTFNEESRSLTDPFVTIELTGVVPGRHWVTSAIQSMNAVGDHTTGWVALSLNARRLSPDTRPVLSGQLWAESLSTNLSYCAGKRTLQILPGSH